MTTITALPTELATMREVVETLAPIERAAGEPGEQQAADWIVERLTSAGAHNARIEEEQFYAGYPGCMPSWRRSVRRSASPA